MADLNKWMGVVYTSIAKINGVAYANINTFMTLTLPSQVVNDRGVFGGGYATAGNANVIDYITISTAGNATDFGDLTAARYFLAACSSSTRGVFGGGYTGNYFNVIEYITIITTGNATDFGDLSARRDALTACSSATRGVFGGGHWYDGAETQHTYDIIEYITIASTGNTTDFGDLTAARKDLSACSSTTRGVFGGGLAGPVNIMDYITIATTGNATDFGDLTVARYGLTACSSSTRGVFGGGQTTILLNVIDYITIATTGNATDFGDILTKRYKIGSCSSSTRGIFGGGTLSSDFSASNIIEYITIASTGNSSDFGDLTVARENLANGGLSDCHGGLA